MKSEITKEGEVFITGEEVTATGFHITMKNGEQAEAVIADWVQKQFEKAAVKWTA